MEIAASTSLIATKETQGDLAPQQVKKCQSALAQIKGKLQSAYINEAQINLDLTEIIYEELEKESSSLDIEHPAEISLAQKTEHILRTTLHYFRIWKRDVFNFK